MYVMKFNDGFLLLFHWCILLEIKSATATATATAVATITATTAAATTTTTTTITTTTTTTTTTTSTTTTLLLPWHHTIASSPVRQSWSIHVNTLENQIILQTMTK